MVLINLCTPRTQMVPLVSYPRCVGETASLTGRRRPFCPSTVLPSPRVPDPGPHPPPRLPIARGRDGKRPTCQTGSVTRTDLSRRGAHSKSIVKGGVDVSRTSVGTGFSTFHGKCVDTRRPPDRDLGLLGHTVVSRESELQ